MADKAATNAVKQNSIARNNADFRILFPYSDMAKYSYVLT